MTIQDKQEIEQISQWHEVTSEAEEDEGDELILDDEYEYENEDEDIEESVSCCWRILDGVDYGNKNRRSFWSIICAGDSRANKWVVQEWNRIFLFICLISLFVDPLFLYVFAISEAYMCMFVDGWLAITVTVLRTVIDLVHLWNMYLQFRFGPYKNRVSYLKDKQGFLLHLFLILPLPQIVLWVVIPYLLRKGKTDQVMNISLSVFVFQYLGKVYHCACLLRRLRRLSVYIFGSGIWWGLALNIIAYFVASHAAGACWYLLGIQRLTNCLTETCNKMKGGCNPKVLAFDKQPIYYGDAPTKSMTMFDDRLFWASITSARSNCLNSYDNYDYGAYQWIIFLAANNSRLEKILMPMFWGLMTMSTFGNLESTTDWVESLFIIIILTSGLLLVTTLIGNIKVFMHSSTSKKQAMQLRMRNIEWWMQKRKLPPPLKQRVRNYEWQRWAAMRGVDECDMIYNLPEGLRRDIKYHLCLDLVKQVPLFQHMDDLVLENICDRVKSLIFTQGETIAREGDPIRRMVFIVRGHLQSFQFLRDGVTKSSCTLGPGNFTGDELLSWCLKRPFNERLPPSSSTLVTLEPTEAFGLEAEDVKYVTQHFRYTFTNEKVKRSARYYSPAWRTWAAVAIQLAWRRNYKGSLSLITPRRPLSRTPSSLGTEDHRLRLFMAILTSPKPVEDEDYIDF